MTNFIVIDWETRSSRDLTKVGAYRYAADPTTDILCMAIGNTRGRASWRPGRELPSQIQRAIDEGWTWVAHNTPFEREIWRQIATPDYGWPKCPPLELWHDTMSRAYQLALPGALEDVLRVMGLGIEKDLEGRKLTLSLSKVDKKTGAFPVCTPEILDRICTYCESDIDGEVALVKRLGWLPECERDCWIGSQRMNDRGIALDMELVDAMQAVVDKAIPPLAAEFRDITGVNPTQGAKFLAWLSEQGVQMLNLRKETVAEILADSEQDEESQAEDDTEEPDEEEILELPPEARRALEIRQLIGSSSIKKLRSINDVVGLDGRARGLLVYHRTTPGRQGATLFQAHNFPKPTLVVDGEGHDPEALVELIKLRDPELLEMAYGVGAVECVVSGLRHTLVAERGRTFFSGDYSGIQARVVLALAGQYDKTELLLAGFDPYIDNACDIWPALPRPDWHAGKAVFGPQVKAFKEQFPKERGTGKNSVLGLGFQMGGRTYRIKYAKNQSLVWCEEVVQTYRRKWAPKVPQLWYDLQDAAVDCVWTGETQESHGFIFRREDIWMTIEIPNGKGSRLWYARPRPIMKPMWWDPEDVRRAVRYEVMKNGHWVHRDMFGGQITENIVMKIEREVMEDAKRRLERAGYNLVLEVHDENLAEAHPWQTLDEYKEILEDVEDWVHALRIPIQVDCWSGPRYRK